MPQSGQATVASWRFCPAKNRSGPQRKPTLSLHEYSGLQTRGAKRMAEHSGQSDATSQVPLGSFKAVTFALSGEDHTLGNALRSLLARNLDVEFVGYSIPHPTQPEMNFRLQTYNRPAVEVLEDGLDTLIAVCDQLVKTYKHSTKKFMKMADQ